MTKEELLKEFKKLRMFDTETAHAKAVELLLQYINDTQITKVFDKLEKWYG